MKELENSLPNGFHDTELKRISIDYPQRLMIMDLAIFVGDPIAAPEVREAYRDATLTISELQFAAIDPPDARYPFSKSGPMRIDACEMTGNLDANLVKTLPAHSFTQSFFVADWNAFIHVAASSAEIKWTAPIEYRTRQEHFLPGENIDL